MPKEGTLQTQRSQGGRGPSITDPNIKLTTFFYRVIYQTLNGLFFCDVANNNAAISVSFHNSFFNNFKSFMVSCGDDNMGSASARPIAIPSPIPRLAPVTTATFPFVEIDQSNQESFYPQVLRKR